MSICCLSSYGVSLFFDTQCSREDLLSVSHTISLIVSDITTTAIWVTIMIHPQGCMAVQQLGNGNVAVIVFFLFFLYAHSTNLICISKIITACYCLLYGLLVNNWAS